MAILHDCRHDAAVYRPGKGCNGSNGRVGGVAAFVLPRPGGSRKWNI